MRFIQNKELDVSCYSPVTILKQIDEWVQKIVHYGVLTYQAFLRNEVLDKTMPEGAKLIDPRLFAKSDEDYFYVNDKFKSEFIEFHRQYDPEFISEVRSGNMAKRLLDLDGPRLDIKAFESKLTQFFENNQFLNSKKDLVKRLSF